MVLIATFYCNYSEVRTEFSSLNNERVYILRHVIRKDDPSATVEMMSMSVMKVPKNV